MSSSFASSICSPVTASMAERDSNSFRIPLSPLCSSPSLLGEPSGFTAISASLAIAYDVERNHFGAQRDAAEFEKTAENKDFLALLAKDRLQLNAAPTMWKMLHKKRIIASTAGQTEQ